MMLARLAVDERHQRKSIGRAMLLPPSNSSGAVGIVGGSDACFQATALVRGGNSAFRTSAIQIDRNFPMI